MKIGLAYDLKSAEHVQTDEGDDSSEEYDPPETIDSLTTAITLLGHKPVRLGGGRDFLHVIQDADVDLVFNISEGHGSFRSREAQVPSVLEMVGVPYTGSDPLTLGLALDKSLAKRIVGNGGVRTPWFRLVESLSDLDAIKSETIPFPLVVKPAFEGSSKGIRDSSKVEDWTAMERVVRSLVQDYRQPALIEQFIPGREITVGVVGNKPPRIVGIMEVVPHTGLDDDFMYTIDVKRNWRDLVRYDCPPHMEASTLQAIESQALLAYKALGCRDVARMDFRVASDGQPHFLEANPLPGMGGYSDLPIMAGLQGWSFTQLVDAILSSAIERTRLERLS